MHLAGEAALDDGRLLGEEDEGAQRKVGGLQMKGVASPLADEGSDGGDSPNPCTETGEAAMQSKRANRVALLFILFLNQSRLTVPTRH